MKLILKIMAVSFLLIFLSGCFMDIEKARTKCSKACENNDKEDFCEKKISVSMPEEGRKVGDTTCQYLAMNQDVESCNILCNPPPQSP